MSKITRKTALKSVDGTPKKRMFLSIISDYDLKTGICELIDNSIDQWQSAALSKAIDIRVDLDVDRQVIRLSDNAGGVREEDIENLIAPGATRNDSGGNSIGVFGVGGKRAGIALGELVEIRTRYMSQKSIQVDINQEWIASPDWELEIYEIPPIEKNSTIVDISKVRQSFNKESVDSIRKHLGETYSWFIEAGCKIFVGQAEVPAISFDNWSFPPDFLPRTAEFEIQPVLGRSLNVSLAAGLINDRDPELENYGVYFYCNNRLILKELRSRDVGYFVSAEAGVPHPDASMSRVIIRYDGPSDLMPWNSSKNGINFSHPAFLQIRSRVIDFNKFYTGASRRTKGDWSENVLKHGIGTVQTVAPDEALSNKRTVLPKLPRSRNAPRLEILKDKNKNIISQKPWTLGLVEAMGAIDIISRQKFSTKNRISLILLDSNFEIAIKEFIVNRADLFPPFTYNDKKIAELFAKRTLAVNEVNAKIGLSSVIIGKINHYYAMRNKLIHERASMQVTDEQIADYQNVIETVLKKLFDLKFPN